MFDNNIFRNLVGDFNPACVASVLRFGNFPLFWLRIEISAITHN